MTAQVTDHKGGVWSIAVPIPDNPLGHTLVHLLETDRGPVLIDTGWDDPDSWDTLVAGVTACGFALTDLHGVLITHHHPDHHGLSAKVREASGAWIAMHAADTEVVRRTRAAEPGQWLDYLLAKLTAAGAPDDHLAPLRKARATGSGRKLPGRRAALPDRGIDPGELLDLPGRRVRAIWTPGHTPGHVCLHLEEEHPSARTPGFGRLFSGDHLLPGITPHIGLYEAPDEEGVRPARTAWRAPGRTPTPWATISTPSNASPGSAPPRCCPPTSTPSPTPAAGCATSSPTTKSGWPSSGHSSRNRAPSGSSPWPWSGTARGSRSLPAPAISLSPRPRPICAIW